jgi:hypothetical protein
MAAAVLAFGALSFGGCGGDDATEPAADAGTTEPTAERTVDDAQVEAGIKQDLATASVQVKSAKCPNDVAVETGATFTCSVSFSNGASGKARVTQLGGSRYSYELKPGSVQVPGATADAAIEKSLAAQGVPNATVDCPQNIIVKVGTTVTCNVSGAQGAATGTVTFAFSSEDGTIDQTSVQTS